MLTGAIFQAVNLSKTSRNGLVAIDEEFERIITQRFETISIRLTQDISKLKALIEDRNAAILADLRDRNLLSSRKK